ncbi:MAG: hypothetical protein NT016_00620 [Candidatus Aenigmarchaeota archaeon]|nr:hypothetical protein [Candidatus Aenigmarchaeota archaeon]
MDRIGKLIFVTIVAGALLTFAPAAMASSVVAVGTTSSSNYIAVDQTSLRATLLNQDPVSAEPGSYVNLLFKLENWGTMPMNDANFTLVQAFPFTLDPGTDATVQLGTVGSLARGATSYFIKYKVKVDADAVGGENQIKVEFGNATSLSQQTLNVSVEDPRTDFDVITQGSTSAASATALSSTNLVIANIGANTAYSTIVSVPDQSGFRVSGDYASIVGNLNAGDYTLVSFTVVPMNATAAPAQNGRRDLIVEVSYTDGLGIRRTVDKNVPIDVSGSSSVLIERARTTSTSNGTFQLFGSTGMTYITIGVVGIVAIVLLFKVVGRKKKMKG